MYRGTNKMDSRYMFEILRDKAFIIEKIFAEGIAELERQVEEELIGTCPQMSIRNDD